MALYDSFDVPEGDSPETVAYKVYGSTEYFWIVCLLNNVVNRFYDWPLDEYNFQQFVKDKYDNPKLQYITMRKHNQVVNKKVMVLVITHTN